MRWRSREELAKEFARARCALLESAPIMRAVPFTYFCEPPLNFGLIGGLGNEDYVVVVLPLHGLAFGFEDADDQEGHVVDADRLADRI